MRVQANWTSQIRVSGPMSSDGSCDCLSTGDVVGNASVVFAFVAGARYAVAVAPAWGVVGGVIELIVGLTPFDSVCGT